MSDFVLSFLYEKDEKEWRKRWEAEIEEWNDALNVQYVKTIEDTPFLPINEEIISKAVLYEANIRQYSVEGSFNAFAEDLHSLWYSVCQQYEVRKPFRWWCKKTWCFLYSLWQSQ